MDDFTNYVLSFVLALVVWGVGALLIRLNSGDSLDYVKWLKIWAVTAAVQTIVFSLILSALFPAPEVKGIESQIDSALSGQSQLPPDVQKELNGDG